MNFIKQLTIIEVIFIIPMVIIISIISMVIYFVIKESNHWEQYKIDNNCVLIKQSEGKTHTIFHAGGSIGFVNESGAKTYKCNNVEITR